MNKRPFYWLLIVIIFSGCSSLALIDLTSLYGPAAPKNRVVDKVHSGEVDYWSQAKPVFDNRCTVCHGCYDAPCQLKTSSIEGIERGASKELAYKQARLTQAPLNRLFFDATDTEQWRQKGFYPALNEHDNIPEANREASLIYKMLELKQKHPLPADKIISDDLDLSLNREQFCPKPEEFPQYAIDFPLGGMPYALPALNSTEQATLMQWLQNGAHYTPRPALSSAYLNRIAQWENYFNGDSKKKQLISRYMYEHLFIANLYFDDLAGDNLDNIFFSLVRSRTPPGQPIDLIASRRPYDNPGVERVYYRLMQNKDSIVDKSHMPYALTEKRLARWKTLFDYRDFQVETLPNYNLAQSSNPFLAFKDLPSISRYKFMLDEAQFTVMAFIKGPVCRGQVALNVINDNFWVYFMNPEVYSTINLDAFFEANGDKYELPASRDSIYRPYSAWNHYSNLQVQLADARSLYLDENPHLRKKLISLDTFWDGNGHNDNAGLTIFRNFDSATVEKGLLGEPPKTAWLLTYPLLERLHYLLVAGYDIYGNAGHQLITRTYMDFLRMEGESNFLAHLPADKRLEELNYWYRNADDDTLEFVRRPLIENNIESTIQFYGDNPKLELYSMLSNRLAPAFSKAHHAIEPKFKQQLNRALEFSEETIKQIPEMSIVQITDKGQRHYFTLLHHNAHTNITSLFNEAENRIPEEDTAEFYNGIIGSYPNAFYRLQQSELEAFMDTLSKVEDDDSYSEFLDRFGVRRSNPDFWAFSDQVHEDYRKLAPIDAGLFDYNRLENR